MEKNKSKQILFKDVCNEWLSLKENEVKESSFLTYKFKIDKHISKDLGNKTLIELEKINMNLYIKNKRNELKNATISNLIIILKSILKYTNKKYNTNIDLDLIKTKKIETKEIEIFNEYEKQKLTKYLSNSKNIKTLGIFISLYSGLRIGEVCGLKWEDIDFESKLISVNRTVQRVYLEKNNTKVIVSTPKSIKSTRKIPISKNIFSKLKETSKNYPPNAYILTGTPNKYTEPLVYQYTYKQILKKCLIKYKKYHCLRHTFATRCIRVGMDVKSLSEVLGHADINITLTTYVHSSYETKKKYIDKI